MMNQQEFLLLKSEELLQLLSSDDLNIQTEETVFHALRAWIQVRFEV